MLRKLFGSLLQGWKSPVKHDGENLTLLEEAVELMASGDLHAAITAFRKCLQFDPENIQALNNLGVCLNDVGKDAEARATFELVYSLDDTFAPGLVNYARMLIGKRQSAEALLCLKQVKISDSTFSHTDAVYAGLCLSNGEVRKAKHFQRRAWLSNFDKMRYANCYLFYSAYDDLDEAILASEHQFWAETVRPVEWGKPADIKALSKFKDVPRGISKRIRLGYWSPDFRNHSVRYFFRPLLEGHDTSIFEIFLYHDGPDSDAQTELIKGAGEHVYDTFDLSDSELFSLIKSHDLDILVELAGHSSHNRITLLQHRFASVQMTALGYPPTTGLGTMDAKVIDSYVNTENSARHYSESPLILPSSFWCFDPKDDIPITHAPPVDSNGFITFGCAGNIAKINMRMLCCWRDILDKVPNSRLLIRSISFEDVAAEEALLELLLEANVNIDRVDLRKPEGGNAFFSSYAEIDIVLDTFPFNGGTTTCFATYMGVPVISLIGASLIGRMGLSILSNLGVPELAVLTEKDYVNRAVEISNDHVFLRKFRQDARGRFQRSSLGNGKLFAKDFEQACLGLLDQKRNSSLTYQDEIFPLAENEIIRRAYTVLRYGQVDAALRILNFCLKHYPDSGGAHLFVAQRLSAEQRYEEAENYIMARLDRFKVDEKIAALINMARLYILRGNKGGALGIIDRVKLLEPEDAFDCLQIDLYQACCMAPIKHEARSVELLDVSHQRIHIIIPCDDIDFFNSLRKRIQINCQCPKGWEISYECCSEGLRVVTYREAAKVKNIDILIILQKTVEIYNPSFFVELTEALIWHDVIGFAGASRWQRIDWRFDEFEYKAAGFMMNSTEQPGFIDIQLLGKLEGGLVADMAILDGNLLALKPKCLSVADFDDALLGADYMLEEDWTQSLFQAGLRLAVHRNLGVLIHQQTNQQNARVRGPAIEKCLEKHGFDPFAINIDDFLIVSAPVANVDDAVNGMSTFLKMQASNMAITLISECNS